MSSYCSLGRLALALAGLLQLLRCCHGLEIVAREGLSRGASFRADPAYTQDFEAVPQQSAYASGYQQPQQGVLPYDARGYAVPQVMGEQQFPQQVSEGAGPVPGIAADYGVDAAMPYAVPIAYAAQQGPPQLMGEQWPQQQQQQQQQWLMQQQVPQELLQQASSAQQQAMQWQQALSQEQSLAAQQQGVFAQQEAFATGRQAEEEALAAQQQGVFAQQALSQEQVLAAQQQDALAQQALPKEQVFAAQQQSSPAQQADSLHVPAAAAILSQSLPNTVSLIERTGRFRFGGDDDDKQGFNWTEWGESVANHTDWMNMNPTQTAISGAIWLVLLCIVAFFYKDHKMHPPVQKHDRQYQVVMGQWSFGLFDCCADPCLFLFSCCCGSIRWADTMRMGNFMGYWQAFFIYALLQQIAPMPYVGFIAGFLWTVIVVSYRQKIRKRFHIPYFDCSNCSGSCMTIPIDCCTYTFCTACAIMQEARQFEEFYQQDPLRAQTAGVGHDVDYQGGGVGWRGNPQAVMAAANEPFNQSAVMDQGGAGNAGAPQPGGASPQSPGGLGPQSPGAFATQPHGAMGSQAPGATLPPGAMAQSSQASPAVTAPSVVTSGFH